MEETQRKKIADLSISELKTYAELAQQRYDQTVKMYQINKTEPGYRNDNERKFHKLRIIVERLNGEIEQRLLENLDLS